MLGLVDNKFMIGRDVYTPISAEIHYFRVPKKYWSICFERIKKAGFRIISSYVPWNLHEEKPGEFDFQGVDNPYKDLIVFLELAREFGFKIILRPGPWVKAEWPNGGLPKYIFSDESLIARDSNNSLLLAKNNGVKSGYQPSYLHPKYVSHVKRYVGGLVEAIQNYIFPKGPVFLMQLDNEINFGGNDKIFEADYNGIIVNELFPAFLEEKYENIKNLPIGYGKAKGFNGITPPTEFMLKKPEQLVIYFDWLEFKGRMIRDYVNILKDRWESLGVGCMFSVAIPASFNFGVPVPWHEIRGERTILGTSIEYGDDIAQVGQKLRLAESIAGYSWSSQLSVGSAHDSTDKPQAIDHRRQRFLLVSALAAGLKGMNYYMFVGRDHWTGAALDADGTVNESYDYIRKLNVAFDTINFGSAVSKNEIGIGLYKPYHWYNQLGANDEFAYINDLVNQTMQNIQSDLSSLNFDYDIYDLDSIDETEDFGDNKLLFVPSADFMSETVQNKLVDLINNGMIVVFVGMVPRFDMAFNPSKTLSKNLGIQTKIAYSPAQITTDNHSFKSITYGSIQVKGTVKTIAKADSKIVGVTKKLGKGKFYFFTYDIAAGSEPGQLCFLKEVLGENQIVTPITCSRPGIDAVIRTNDKGALLFLVNSGAGQLQSNKSSKVIVSVDLTPFGFRQAKLELYDIFDAENKIKTTIPELKDGLIFELGYLDALVYWIPKK